MAIDDIQVDFTEIFPPELAASFETLITILQAVGFFIILYLIFNIINTLLNRKKNQEVRKISANVEEIKRLLKNKVKKTKK